MSQRVHDLSQGPSIINPLLAEIRDVDIQTDPMRFRRNMERFGEIMALEISRQLDYRPRTVQTPLATMDVPVLTEQPVLATILRAGLPLHQGLLNVFDRADNAFVSAYRRHEGDAKTFKVEVEYLACPDIEGRTVILSDPMLATGSSMVLSWQALLERGTPRCTHVAAVIASRQGVETVLEALPENTQLWLGAIDDTLNDRAYIVPGLGDAGDLCYGEKA